MIQFFFRQKQVWLLLFLLISTTSSFAQLPQCDRIYLDQIDLFSFQSTQRIYNYNPTLPMSATNPTLNTILLPSVAANGLTVSEVLGSSNTTLTFYTVVNDKYWYYNPATSAWVNTNHITGSTNVGVNIASGGGFIYNLVGMSGEIYKYDGTGNGSLLTTISDFSGDSPFDLIADCAGNFYVLNSSGNLTSPYLRKYNSSGVLVQSWILNNPNGYLPAGGFGIIGTNIYVDNNDFINGVLTVAAGTINASSADLTSNSTAMIPFAGGQLIGDLGSCASGVPVLPQITITASATTIAAGASVTFSSSINAGGTAPTYQWFVNGNPIAGATGSTFTYNPQDGDVVTCRLTSNLGCVIQPTAISNAITIIADGCQPPKLAYEPSSLCKGAGQAVPQFSPSGGSFSATPTGLSINNSTGAINLNTSNIGSYIITYTVPASPICEARSTTDTVTVSPLPTADITMEEPDGKLCQNSFVTLKTPASQGWVYEWYPRGYFPGVNNAATVSAKVVYPGMVYVTVSTEDGCKATDSLFLNPEVCCNVMIPTAFTPNGDGVNDIFKVFSGNPQKINQLSVFNRWGQRVFNTTSQEKGWDGFFNEKAVDAGVYFYYLSYTCSDGQTIEKKGDVSLIR